MKKAFAVIIILILAAGGFIISRTILQITPANISRIDIKDLEAKAAQTHHPDASSAESLLAGLDGTPVRALPDTVLRSYDLTLYNVWGVKKAFRVHFDSKYNVFVRHIRTNRLTVADDPGFFYSHESFDSLYPYSSHPRTEWSLASEALDIEAADTTWSFKRLDGTWHTDNRQSAVTDKTFKITAPDAVLSFRTDYSPSLARLEVRDEEGGIVLEQEIKGSSIPVPDRDGVYNYLVEMIWPESENPYKGNCVYRFNLAVDLPASFEIPKLSVVQGDIIKILVYNVNEGEVPVLKQTLFKQFRFYRNGDAYVGCLPTGYSTPPGKYEFEYGIEGGRMTKEVFIIEARDFHIQHLVIDEKIEASTRNDAAYAEYDKYFVPVRRSSSDELYYSEPFAIPAAGRLSTEYGETRHVNGSPTSYRHSGLDIAAPQGTPVYAANRGKVVLSMYLTLTGNTIVIDHGQGLFSVYFHMHKLIAEQNSIVSRGQQIGTVGTTGFSTGPHLHFTMSYYDRNIEPGYFLAGEPITRGNYKEYLK